MSNVTVLSKLQPAVEEGTLPIDVTGFEDMPMVMSPKALAESLDITVRTLERWRVAKIGPAWHSLPGSSLIRYARSDVLVWLRECRVEVSA